MALSYSSLGGGGIKSVQRGLASGSGNVTITAVNTSKAFVHCFGTASSGTVAASGSVNAANGNISAANGNAYVELGVTNGSYGVGTAFNGSATQYQNISGIGWPWLKSSTGNISVGTTSFTGNSTNITGGSNNLVSAVVQAYLSDSTTLVVSGACRWEVVEFN